MTDLTIRDATLPDSPGDLSRFILIGKEKLKAYEARLRAVNKAGFAKEVRDMALEDSQEMAAALLSAEARLGDLLALLCPSQAGRTKVLPDGITHKQSHFAQEISKNRDLIQKAIDRAIEKEDIPRRADVLKAIQKKKRQKEPSQDIPIPLGKYKTIVIDPPWPVRKILREERPKQNLELDYPIMPVEKIRDFPIEDIVSEDGCHIYLWTTQKFLPYGFQILEAWGFKYIFTMVWHKNGGYQPFGLPQYNCEFVLFGKQGDIKFETTKDFFCCFNGKRRQHSRKPSEFYDTVKRVSPAPRIDIFNRGAIDGFDQYGNETEKF